jgi:hypothetical protein
MCPLLSLRSPSPQRYGGWWQYQASDSTLGTEHTVWIYELSNTTPSGTEEAMSEFFHRCDTIVEFLSAAAAVPEFPRVDDCYIQRELHALIIVLEPLDLFLKVDLASDMVQPLSALCRTVKYCQSIGFVHGNLDHWVELMALDGAGRWKLLAPPAIQLTSCSDFQTLATSLIHLPSKYHGAALQTLAEEFSSEKVQDDIKEVSSEGSTAPKSDATAEETPPQKIRKPLRQKDRPLTEAPYLLYPQGFLSGYGLGIHREYLQETNTRKLEALGATGSENNELQSLPQHSPARLHSRHCCCTM